MMYVDYYCITILQYPYMICVEAGYVSESRTVQPGETYEASQSIKIM